MGDFSTWVDVAQVASGFAALAAVWVALVTVRAGRRTPMADAYLGAWDSVVRVASEASEERDAPPAESRANELMREFRAADRQLSAIEAALRVRVYGRQLRHQLNNLLIDVLYDNPEIRGVAGSLLTLDAFPRPEWANCSDDDWLRVANSVPFASMLVSQVWEAPGAQDDDDDGLMRWYYPTVLRSLDARGSLTAASAEPQQQLAFMLSAYIDAFLLPWMRDASREALLGRLGRRGHLRLWRQRRTAWRHAVPRRQRDRSNYPVGLFSPTGTRR